MINRFIERKYPDIRLVGEDGGQLGIYKTREACRMAADAGLDLVLVAENASPPVCRIADYGKLRYEEKKRKQANKKRVQETHSLKISPRIAQHDIDVSVKKAREFLTDGDKVQFVCQFRAREVAHPELGFKNLGVIIEALKDVSVVETAPRLDGKQMRMLLNAKKA